jgi:hypothetical protein
VFKPYDATSKELVEAAPATWAVLGAEPVVDPATVIDSDLATITTDADKVIHVEWPGQP